MRIAMSVTTINRKSARYAMQSVVEMTCDKGGFYTSRTKGGESGNESNNI